MQGEKIQDKWIYCVRQGFPVFRNIQINRKTKILNWIHVLVSYIGFKRMFSVFSSREKHLNLFLNLLHKSFLFHISCQVLDGDYLKWKCHIMHCHLLTQKVLRKPGWHVLYLPLPQQNAHGIHLETSIYWPIHVIYCSGIEVSICACLSVCLSLDLPIYLSANQMSVSFVQWTINCKQASLIDTTNIPLYDNEVKGHIPKRKIFIPVKRSLLHGNMVS